MKRREPQISSTGILLVTIGSVVGIGIWIAAIFGLDNSMTHASLDKLGSPTVDPNVNASSSSSASSSGEGSTSGSGATAATGASSGGPNGLPFAVSSPTNTTLLAKSMPGYTIFENTCATCHGADLKGVIGPELLGIGNVATEPKLLATVTHGFPNMMPAAGGLTNPNDVKEVVAWLMQQKQK